MTTSALIDLILTHTDEVGSSDGENTTLRARVLARAQELLELVWDYAEWDFKISSGNVSCTSGEGSLPTDFGDIGDNGGVYIAATKRKLSYLEPRELARRVEMEGSTTSTPTYYTVFGYDTSGSDGQRKLKLYPLSTVTAKVYYNKTAPTLVDATDATNNLQALPVKYHRMVMVPGLQLKTAIDKGDGRTAEFDAWFKEAMRQMKARHVYGREQSQMVGQYGGVPSFRSW